MKYKVGDEVLVKARIIRSYRDGKYIIEINEDGYYTTFDYEENDIFPYPSMTAEEAWEIAKKLFADYSNVELDEIFGKGWSFPKLMELTPQQAKAKIDAWKAEEEIKVGDEVVPKKTPNVDEHKFIVTRIYKDDGKIDGVSLFDGGVFSGRKIENYQKTGRHIDIEGLLKQIGGDE